MEHSRKGAKFGKVSFHLRRSSPYTVDKRMEQMDEPKPLELCRGKLQIAKCCSPLEIPKSPQEGMEFLSRTWSTSSSDFFQMLSSNNLIACFEGSEPEEKDDRVEDQEREKSMVRLINGGTRQRTDQILPVVSGGKSHDPSSPRHLNTFLPSWMSVKHMKAWMRGELLSSHSREHKRKKKEEVRLRVAEVHAALSVARLAAAIAGTVAGSNMKLMNNTSKSLGLANNNNNRGGEWDKNVMNKVVASAAALVASVCAEAAESVGAERAHITSAIKMGLEMRNSSEMLALTTTTTAATCLRGAAALELGTVSNNYVPEEIKILQRGARIRIRMPTGRVQVKMTSVRFKQEKLTLRMGKRHLRGAFITYEEYRIFEELEDPPEDDFSKEDHSLCAVLSLSTTGGAIMLLFEDQNQYTVWKYTIYHLLSRH